MVRYDLAVLDNVPRAASGAQVYVYTQATTGITPPTEDGAGNTTPGSWSASATPIASIFKDAAGSQALSNPFHLDGNGNGWFYAAAGLYTVVIVGSTLAYPSILVDQLLVAASGTSVSLKTNGSTNSTQSLLNLVQSGSITISESGGNVTVTGTAANITFKVNGTSLGSQTVVNFVNGTGIAFTDGGSGEVIATALSINAFKVNGTTLTAQSPVNFQNGPGIVISNPSAGNVMVSGTPVYMVGSATQLVAPKVQFGSGNLSAGTLSVTLPVAFTSGSTYVATACAQGSGAAFPLSVTNSSGTVFVISALGPSGGVVSVEVAAYGSPSEWYVTVVCDQNFLSGQSVTFSDLTTATFLNGETLTINACNGGTFVCQFPGYSGGPYGPTSDTGSIYSEWSNAGSVVWTAIGN